VEILEKVKEVAGRSGIQVEIKVYEDYKQLNPAVTAGELDLNSFQYIPYLTEYLENNRGVKLIALGATYVSPMGIYSKKIKSLDELKEGDSVGIPNDPSNGGRALFLLQKAGKITLRETIGLTAGPQDIISNPLNLKFIMLEVSDIPSARDEATIIAINTNYAQPLGIVPLRDAIYLEAEDSPYVNIIVTREEDKDRPDYLKFVKSYQSQEVADFIIQKYKGSTIPVFPYIKRPTSTKNNLGEEKP
jgi:D-methionine transport system substrate-binding protein